MRMCADQSPSPPPAEETTPHDPDFHVLLYRQVSGLITVFEVVKQTAEFLGPYPCPESDPISPAAILQVFGPQLNQLQVAVRALVGRIEQEQEERGIPRELFVQFTQGLDALSRLQLKTDPVLLPAGLRTAARHIDSAVVELRRQKAALPHEPAKHIHQVAKEIERLACLYDLLNAQAQMRALEHDARMLVERRKAATGQQTEVFLFSAMVRMVVNQERARADSRSLDFRLADGAKGAVVAAPVQDVAKALTNLIGNAIKYNWSLRGEARAWVKVRTTESPNTVSVSVESWGTPITQDEVEQELVFQQGRRGICAQQAGIDGTGLGLAKARAIARQYGGDVTVDSRPARSSARPDNYNEPFLTTATLTLPRAS